MAYDKQVHLLQVHLLKPLLQLHLYEVDVSILSSVTLPIATQSKSYFSKIS